MHICDEGEFDGFLHVDLGRRHAPTNSFRTDKIYPQSWSTSGKTNDLLSEERLSLGR